MSLTELVNVIEKELPGSTLDIKQYYLGMLEVLIDSKDSELFDLVKVKFSAVIKQLYYSKEFGNVHLPMQLWLKLENFAPNTVEFFVNEALRNFGLDRYNASIWIIGVNELRQKDIDSYRRIREHLRGMGTSAKENAEVRQRAYAWYQQLPIA